MVVASSVGAIDFTAWQRTKRGWQQLTLVTNALDHQTRVKVLELDAIKAVGAQAIAGVGAEECQNYARAAIDRYEAAVLPWFVPYEGENTGTMSYEDRMAQWVTIFGNDLDVLRTAAKVTK